MEIRKFVLKASNGNDKNRNNIHWEVFWKTLRSKSVLKIVAKTHESLLPKFTARVQLI